MRSTISGLRSDLLPHRQWAVSKWFYANPLWYYHRRGTDEEIVANRRFYQLVDPDLREVCKLLNDAGLHTTPSCQGHFYGRDRFEKIWDELKTEEPSIRGSGLTVKDSETDREWMFLEPQYRLPWESFEKFFEEAVAHQGIGYLGIVAWPEMAQAAEQIRRAKYESAHTEVVEDPELGRVLGGMLFNVYVKCRGPDERAEEWKKLTEWVREVLERSTDGAALSALNDQRNNV